MRGIGDDHVRRAHRVLVVGVPEDRGVVSGLRSRALGDLVVADGIPVWHTETVQQRVGQVQIRRVATVRHVTERLHLGRPGGRRQRAERGADRLHHGRAGAARIGGADVRVVHRRQRGATGAERAHVGELQPRRVVRQGVIDRRDRRPRRVDRLQPGQQHVTGQVWTRLDSDQAEVVDPERELESGRQVRHHVLPTVPGDSGRVEAGRLVAGLPDADVQRNDAGVRALPGRVARSALPFTQTPMPIGAWLPLRRPICSDSGSSR